MANPKKHNPKLLPFNRTEAQKGAKIVTRNGLEYKFGSYNPEAIKSQRVVGWIDQSVMTHYDDGSHSFGAEFDLFIVPKITKVWLAVYKFTDGRLAPGTIFYDSKEACQKNNLNKCIIVSINIEEK